MKTFLLIIAALLFYSQCYAQTAGYKKPIPAQDGWEVASAESMGLSEDSLGALVDLIRSTPPGDFRALTIARDGVLVLDEYFNSYNRNTIHDIRSATKSITALLAGIAMADNLIDNVDVPLFKLIPRAAPYVADVPEKADITLRDALTMRSGLDADANNPASPGNEANWLDGEEDWLDVVLAIPMTNQAPGSEYVYNSANAFLVGAAIESVSGMPLRSFAATYLFKPLGIHEFYWAIGPGGHTAGMGNLYLTNRALAKIGQLVLDDGIWQGQTILPSGWAHEVIEKRVDFTEPFLDTHGYGYMWYVGTKTIGDRQIDFVYASGNGGNVIYIVPLYDIVVAMSSSAYSTGYGGFRSNNIFEYILRAIET